ncbi:MAG: hypothetical protein PF904_13465 [Kiritimatiellae bacterium]|jgi:hypothetical protein|nr:hypothetical protein [Kiritimatiellia bacterium]
MGKKKKNKKPKKAAEKKHPITTEASSFPEPSAIFPVQSTESPIAQQNAPDEFSSELPEKIPELTPETPETPEKHITHSSAPKSRFRRMLPDILRVILALSVIAAGIAIWFKPPLFTASFPTTTYQYKGKPAQQATLYRPIAMQERYYVELPDKLENRYQWFAIDRRREEVALCDEPQHRFLGKRAIKRGDPLGLDLEFRTLDGHEWLIYFYTDAIVFSNNLLCVRLDAKGSEK